MCDLVTSSFNFQNREGVKSPGSGLNTPRFSTSTSRSKCEQSLSGTVSPVSTFVMPLILRGSSKTWPTRASTWHGVNSIPRGSVTYTWRWKETRDTGVWTELHKALPARKTTSVCSASFNELFHVLLPAADFSLMAGNYSQIQHWFCVYPLQKGIWKGQAKLATGLVLSSHSRPSRHQFADHFTSIILSFPL